MAPRHGQSALASKQPTRLTPPPQQPARCAHAGRHPPSPSALEGRLAAETKAAAALRCPHQGCRSDCLRACRHQGVVVHLEDLRAQLAMGGSSSRPNPNPNPSPSPNPNQAPPPWSSRSSRPPSSGRPSSATCTLGTTLGSSSARRASSAPPPQAQAPTQTQTHTQKTQTQTQTRTRTRNQTRARAPLASTLPRVIVS